jgi:membrane-associated protein
LLVTAGIFSSPKAVGEQLFDPVVLMSCLIAAAILGDQLNYALGAKTGEAVYSRPDSRFIKRKYFERARDFYLEHGASAIVIARFVPILRTFVPFIAGVAQMPYRRFVMFNVFGAVSWVVSMVSIGYFIGGTPIASNLKRVILVVIVRRVRCAVGRPLYVPLARQHSHEWHVQRGRLARRTRRYGPASPPHLQAVRVGPRRVGPAGHSKHQTRKRPATIRTEEGCSSALTQRFRPHLAPDPAPSAMSPNLEIRRVFLRSGSSHPRPPRTRSEIKTPRSEH